MHWSEIHERRAGGVVVLDIRGSMTLSEDQSSLYKHVASLVEQGRQNVLLNLRNVAYIDSLGIGEIVRAYVLLTQHGGKLRLCRVGPRIREVLVATHLHTVLETFDTEVSALLEGYKEA